MSRRLPIRMRSPGLFGVWTVLVVLLLAYLPGGTLTRPVDSRPNPSHVPLGLISHLPQRSGATGSRVATAGSSTCVSHSAGFPCPPAATAPRANAPRAGGYVWSNVTSNQRLSPPGYLGASIAYDSVDNYLLLFGGCSATACPAPASTWRYFGGAWSQATIAGPQPPARAYASMAFDSKDQYVVLFGGLGSGGLALNDTWAYVGGKWTNLNITSAPSPRWAAGATWDHSDAYLLFFGGRSSTGSLYGDTWTFATGSWKNISGSTVGFPPARWGATLVWDEAIGYGILAYGCSMPACPLSDSWVFRAGQWTNVTGAANPAPPPRYLAAATFIGSQGAIYLAGGNDSRGPLGDVWELVSNGWTNVTGSFGAPPGSRFGVAAPDSTTTWGTSAAKQWPFLLLYGGTRAACTTCTAGARNDTWVLEPQLYGSPSALPSVVEAGEPVSFSSSSSGGTAPYYYVWQMGDGTTVVGGSFTHAYSAVGSYSAVMTSTDQAGASARSAAGVTVVAGPAVSLTAARQSTDVGRPLSFSASASGGTPPYAFNWAFGDLTTAAGASASHTYASPGNFSVNVTVTDSVQGSAVRALSVSAHPQPVARATANLINAIPGETVAFRSTVVGGSPPLVYNWSFGDGVWNSTATPFHVFRFAGTFLVALSVTDSLGLASFSNLTLQIVSPGTGGGGGGGGNSIATSPYLFIAIGAAGMAAIAAAVILIRRRRRLNAPLAAAAAGSLEEWYDGNELESSSRPADTRHARRGGQSRRRR